MHPHPAVSGPVATFFAIGLWDTVLNFTRKLVLNLIFFGAAVPDAAHRCSSSAAGKLAG